MNKKRIIIIIVSLLVLIIIGVGVFFITNSNDKKVKTDEKKIVEKKEVVSTVILDINPSIKLELDKDNKIVNVIPLNDDAKEIISNNLEGKELNTAINVITDNLIEKGYTKDNVSILINVSGTIEREVVEETIKTTFTEKEITVSIINQEVTDTAKENASKYNITESKAAYIEEILKEKENLTFEELKDKTIEEITEIKNYVEPKPTPTPTPVPKAVEEPRKGTSSYKCDSVREVMTREQARDKAIETINITDENKKRNSTFGAQITGSEYNNVCSWEVIVAYNKIMYYFYFDYVTGNQVGKVEKRVAVADYYDAEEFMKKYLSENYSANPEEVFGRGMSGTITDTVLELTALYNGQVYKFNVYRESGRVENMRISQDTGVY